MILYSKTNEMLPSDDISTLTEYKLFASSVVQLNGVPSTIKKTAAYYISDIHKKYSSQNCVMQYTMQNFIF